MRAKVELPSNQLVANRVLSKKPLLGLRVVHRRKRNESIETMARCNGTTIISAVRNSQSTERKNPAELVERKVSQPIIKKIPAYRNEQTVPRQFVQHWIE